MTLTDNQLALAKINSTLIPNNDTGGKVGIFLPAQNGDIMTAMSILKYKDVMFPGKQIIWYCNAQMADAFKFGPISEVREYRWEGLDVDPWTQLRTTDGKSLLDQEKKHKFDWSKDLDFGFFPAPWILTVEERHGVDYANIAKKVFGVDSSWEWHPYLGFSDEEREKAKDFCSKLPHKRTVMLETYSTSGQSGWNDNFTTTTIKLCREKWGACNFIFASHKDMSRFVDDAGMVSAADFTVRQTALLMI